MARKPEFPLDQVNVDSLILLWDLCKNVISSSKSCCSAKLFFSFFPLQKTEKTEFLSFFYKHCMHVLSAPLLANTTDETPSKGTEPLRWLVARGCWLMEIEHGEEVSVTDDDLLSSVRWLSDISVAGVDSGVADVLRGAPHLPHQELHHQQGHSQEGTGTHRFSARLSGTMWVSQSSLFFPSDSWDP